VSGFSVQDGLARPEIEEEGKGGSPLPIDSLIALAALRRLKRLTTDELAVHIQREPAQAKRNLEALVEVGLAHAHGATRGRTYTLAPGVYQAEGGKAAYIRQLGFSSLQHEQLVLNYVREHGSIRLADVLELCRISEGQAKDLLKRMKNGDLLLLEGVGRTSAYRLGPKG